MVEDEIKIKFLKGDDLDKLKLEIINLINEHSEELNGYELLGVLDAIKQDIHDYCFDRD